jgi:hypothetical protein
MFKRMATLLAVLGAAVTMATGSAACTDSTCSPGGKPATRRYHLALRVFSRSTGALGTSPGQDDQQWQFGRDGAGWPASPVKPRVQLQRLPGAVAGGLQPGRHCSALLGTAGALLGHCWARSGQIPG